MSTESKETPLTPEEREAQKAKFAAMKKEMELERERMRAEMAQLQLEEQKESERTADETKKQKQFETEATTPPQPCDDESGYKIDAPVSPHSKANRKDKNRDSTKEKREKKHASSSVTSAGATNVEGEANTKEDTVSAPGSTDSKGSDDPTTPKTKQKRDKRDKKEGLDKTETKGSKQDKREKPTGNSSGEEDKPKAGKASSKATKSSSSTDLPSTSSNISSESINKAPKSPKDKEKDKRPKDKKDGEKMVASNSNPSLVNGPITLATLKIDASLKIPVLELSNRKLPELPNDISTLQFLQKIYVGKNRLNDLSPLKSIKELQILSASNNQISVFPIELASEESKLKELLLSDNNISGIPTTLASKFQFPNLAKIDLMANKITIFPEVLSNCKNLSYLNLSFNKIVEIPKSIASLLLLTTLIMHHNQLKKIASAICQLGKLTTLDLHENELTSIPESIGEISTLTSLNVSHNQMKTWPSCFNQQSVLKSLTVLNLSHNSITGDIPSEHFPENEDGQQAVIFDTLEEINLSHNQITSFPSNFWASITNVSILDLKNNKLASLPGDIGSLFSLSQLEVGSNRLTSVPAELSNITSLQVFSCYDNQLNELPDLTTMEYLQYLNIGYNNISEINLDGLYAMEELFLSGNPIKVLPDSIAETCPNLKLIFASDLLLKKLPPTLNGLVMLEQMDFSFNKLTDIPTSIGDLEQLRAISLAHNKIETSKEREVLKTPGKGPWDCIEFWQSLGMLIEVDLSFNKLKLLPKGLETKLGHETDVVLYGNPISLPEKPNILISPVLGKRFQVGWSEMIGRRPTMEDYFCWQGSLDAKSNVDLFGVFDGHAAREAALFCGQQIDKLIAAQLPSDGNIKSPTDFFSKIFKDLNGLLEKHLASVRDPNVKHCGSTAVVVLVAENNLFIANVGDSRAVLNSGERCTVDHKPRSEVDRIRSHPGGFVTGDEAGRINEVLAVSRSLGDFYMAPYVISTPNVFTKTLTKDDKYIILACDGVWDEIDDKAAIPLVDGLVAEGELHRAANKLKNIAYCAGSDDNISVMIIKFNNKS